MGCRITEIRKEKGISQEELSILSGVSRATISGLESGRITVTTTDTLQKISKALGETVSEIFFT
ncbi:MAG: XRE family transcriptional regulator [Clostridiales bacterium]|nr:XRE family transcriptional regulator [Clostridiales bacterium]